MRPFLVSWRLRLITRTHASTNSRDSAQVEAQNGELTKTEDFGTYLKPWIRRETFGTSPRGAPRLTAAAIPSLTVDFWRRTSSQVHRQKIRHTLPHVATPLHGPQNHWGSDGPWPPPRSDHSAKTRCAVYCDKENDDQTCFLVSIELPCRCAYELHAPADIAMCVGVLMCVDVC